MYKIHMYQTHFILWKLNAEMLLSVWWLLLRSAHRALRHMVTAVVPRREGVEVVIL